MANKAQATTLSKRTKKRKHKSKSKPKSLRDRLPRPSLDNASSLVDVLRAVNIGQNSWDYLIVGDGSGTTWGKACGWGSVLIERTSFERQLFHGACNLGTNNMAEIFAVMMPMMFLTNTKKTVKPNGLRVVVLSDSSYVVSGLEQTSPVWASTVAKNRELWLAVHGARRRGLVISPVHIPRDTVDLNKLCHDLANMSRKTQISILNQLNWDVSKTNP